MAMKKGMAKALESAIQDQEDMRSSTGQKSRRIFDSKARREIFTRLTYSPCRSAGDIAKDIGISSNSVLWHLDKLADTGYVVQRKMGRRRLFWPEGAIDEDDIGIFFLLSGETARNIVKVVLESPGISQKDIARRLGLSRQGVSSQAKQLLEASLLDKVVEGVHIRYYPTTYLAKRSDENYERSKSFMKFIIDRLEAAGERPKTIKKSQRIVMLEIGPKSDRTVLEIGLDPFLTVLADEA